MKACTLGKLLCTLALASPWLHAVTVDNSSYRIGATHDGNQHDLDDYAACAMDCALIGEAGLGAKFVHIDVNNHLGNNNATQAATMWSNVTGAVSRWGLTTVNVFDCQTNLAGAVNDIAAQINASTAVNRFYLACAGPMEVAWQGINASNSAARQYCTAISHSVWNDDHADTTQMTHTWSAIQSSGVRTVHITGQNQQGFNASLSSYSWLQNSSDPNWQWLYNRNVKTTWDASDSGIIYYIITGRGDDTPTVTDVQNIFNGNFTYSSGGSGTTLEAESMSPTGVGCTPGNVTDSNASGGIWVGANSSAVGNAMNMTTPSIAAGTYEFRLSYKSGPNRATYTVKVDGIQVGGTLDQYTSAASYPTVVVGNVTFASAGTHTITMTVTGKNASSTGYGLTADAITLVSSTPTAPPAPSGLSATPGNAQVTLNWTAVSGATSYNVKRATVSGGPFTTIASPTGTTYTNTGLTNGAAYYYVVSAVNSVGESTNSNQATATPQAGGVTATFEAENMTPTGMGGTPSTVADTNASGGAWVHSNSVAVGNTMTLTTSSVAAGAYQLSMRYKTGTNRATYTVSVDGTQVGGTLNQYSTAVSYPSAVIGTITFASAGTHTITMIVTGKSASSTGYVMTADSFTFTAQ